MIISYVVRTEFSLLKLLMIEQVILNALRTFPGYLTGEIYHAEVTREKCKF